MFKSILSKQTKGYENLKNLEFEKAAKADSNAVFLDVRTSTEHKGGHIPKSKNLNMMDSNFTGKLEKLDKSKSYYVYCRSGGRSASACQTMSKLGFEKLFNLQGGMLSWHGELKK